MPEGTEIAGLWFLLRGIITQADAMKIINFSNHLIAFCLGHATAVGKNQTQKHTSFLVCYKEIASSKNLYDKVSSLLNCNLN